MNIKTVAFGIVALALLLWASWSFGYHRGYARGARDEFACWKQVPDRADAKVLIGERDPWASPGGKKLAHAAAPRFRDLNVNNIPRNVLP